jgi:hypothetical protein
MEVLWTEFKSHIFVLLWRINGAEFRGKMLSQHFCGGWPYLRQWYSILVKYFHILFCLIYSIKYVFYLTYIEQGYILQLFRFWVSKIAENTVFLLDIGDQYGQYR